MSEDDARSARASGRAAEGPAPDETTTHFGFETVAPQDKAQRVAGVFAAVASRYDLMNDLMSGGLHRFWKRFAVDVALPRPGERILDVAGGTGDMSRLFAARVGSAGEVWLTDINGSMLGVGRDRLTDAGLLVPAVQCDAERLPFPDRYFDCVCVAFGLRNMTRKEQALTEFRRVLRPGGRVLVLEFSRVWKPLEKLYDAYSFGVLPVLGGRVAGDADAYRYLAESIRMHPDQETLAEMMRSAGFEHVDWHNLSAGVVAVHRGYAP
jgi:demethylmenaquinone methyltransferase/2-methoxy-6-polyprenyl-1,4-benzoquinol methylase